jgi:hypothetical protein
MGLANLLPLGRYYPIPRKLNANLAELIDKCVGSQIWVLMNGGKGAYRSRGYFKDKSRFRLTHLEFVGKLIGFDDYVSMCSFRPA